MALAHYAETYWYPDETFAVGVEYHVFPRLSNIHSSLFADQLGTLPLPNPGVTAAGGVIDFWVDEGDYYVYIRDQAFGLTIDVDADVINVWPTTFRHTQAVASAVWTIAHGLDYFPSVEVKDSANAELFGQVDYTDADTLTITFSTPTSGVAYLRR